MAAPFTCHQYPKYKGVTKDGEADEFMEQFENVAIANKEQSDVDKFRIFPSLLRKSARKWFNHMNSPKADWDELKNSFIERFRSLDFKHIVLKRLGSLERKRKESLQDYEERFKELLDRIPRTETEYEKRLFTKRTEIKEDYKEETKEQIFIFFILVLVQFKLIFVELRQFFVGFLIFKK
ncbi:hypothetical protein R1sor_016232 [Riccia sorocarpa]|uniref:Retrotransposon gag domain-containing protein n=1 Tax=Riccia sorocarpa TaxID=122646 RepID=A0ABD3HET9_9MARC